MPRRKKKPGFLETTFGIIVLILIVGAAFGDVRLGLVAVIGVVGVLAIGSFLVSRAEDSRLRQSGIIEVDKMDGASFERYLQAVFSGMGFSVQATPASGDFGADLVIAKDGIRTVVQAKRSSGSIGVRAVQEVLAAGKMYGCTKAIVVTNSRYTAQAQKLAEANGVELWDRDRLVSTIISLQRK
jgi:restriction system protein